jgi:hypothetical protein
VAIETPEDVASADRDIARVPALAVVLPQHADQHGPQRPVLLAVDQLGSS